MKTNNQQQQQKYQTPIKNKFNQEYKYSEISKSDEEIASTTVETKIYTKYSNQSKIQYLILFLTICANLGNYFSDDFPAILEKQIKTHLQINSLQYNLLYTVMSIPPLAFLIGYLIDKLGVFKVMITLNILQTLGQIMCTYGIYCENYYILLAGRLIFGIGLENYNICGYNMISKWIKNNNISLAMGLIVSFGRISMVTSSFLYPQYYDKEQILWKSVILGAYVCIFSLFSVFVLYFFDKKYAFQSKKNGHSIGQEKVDLADIKHFKLIFWLIVLLIMITFMILEPFMFNMQEILIDRYKIHRNHASNLYTFPFILGAFFIPIIGFLSDKYGKKGYFAIAGGLFFNGSFLVFYTKDSCSSPHECYFVVIFALSLLGIGYGIIQSIVWPSINLVVDQKNLGTAGGLANCFLQTGLFINPIAIGIIIDLTIKKFQFDIAILYGLLSTLLITIFAGLINFIDIFGEKKLYVSYTDGDEDEEQEYEEFKNQ
ncbi:major facilitator superfamily protein, putative [Ichthyophthirius multifiliis]|uniref:Lysosomal dipeptide transporter MFSD1 n=1 Tax=Ichthyophthirius multifiliis TaxID=5932 RepID=G0QZC1_ICHMU|nr:major facilitator superfamily protein, putative [Ichthyophthirius multifiliis]EGR29424.1 major facilitator superfamily protein, putative [Ichthyophthirius multifiliis]|eukprot:XP_004030660.1 major facilitator superfamily protein, putative [Ichthyophthirius multifiliis]